MNRIRIALGALFLVLAVSAPTLAENRVNNYYGMVLDQNWLNQAERNPRTGLGQLVYDITGSTSPFFANLVGLPSGGLYMSIGPPTTNSMGALYQYLPDDITPVGGSPIGATGSTTLAADPTTFFLQGLVSSPNITVGPFTPPATSGQSIAYLAECQVQTIDRILQLESFEQLPNYTPATATANEARADVTVCQSKPSSPATSPITPAVDSGWVSFATVTVPAGTTSLAPSNIVRTASTQFNGFVPATASGGIPVAALPHGDYIDVTSNPQTKYGTLTLPQLIVGKSSVNVASVISGGNFTALNGTFISGNGPFQLCLPTSTIGQCPANLQLDGSLTAGTSSTLTQGTIEPVYDAGGNRPTGSPHGVDGTFTCATNASNVCSGTLVFSGAAIYSGQTFECQANFLGQNLYVSGETIYMSASANNAVFYSGVANPNTSYAMHYHCDGT